jgi:hypothetical protein
LLDEVTDRKFEIDPIADRAVAAVLFVDRTTIGTRDIGVPLGELPLPIEPAA